MAEPVRYFSAETTADTGPSYRTLSLTALIGFGLSALYAVFLVLMGLVSFVNSKPLLLSGWSLVPPVAGVILCLIAATQIRNSDGTLAGEKLVRWGLLLALFIGLGYWAYYFAVYFAVRQQATAYAETWLEALREGDPKKVIYYAVRPERRQSLRLDDPALALAIDDVMATKLLGESVQRSPFLHLQQNRLIRLLIQNGKEVKHELKNIRSWTFVRGGYEVILDYVFRTPEGTYEGVVVVTGTEAPHGEYEGRQWVVDLESSRTQLNERLKEGSLTPLGLELARVRGNAARIHHEIRDAFRDNERLPIFLLTLPKEERAAAKEKLNDLLLRTAVAGPAGSLTVSSDLARRYAAFLEGNLARFDPDFITSDEKQKELQEGMRRFFGQADLRIRFDVAEVMPLRQEIDGRLVLRYDVNLTEQNGLFTEGFLEIEGDPKTLESSTVDPAWRIRGLTLLTKKTHSQGRLPPPGR